MKSNENLKKKIIYRSMHRGTKEMDLLLGAFVKKYIDNLNFDELNDLSELLGFDDDVLKEIYFKRKIDGKTKKQIFKLFIDFKI